MQIQTVSRRFSSLRKRSMAKNKDKSNQNAAKEWRERPEPLLAVPEDEREHPPHSLPRLSVVAPCSHSSSADPLPPSHTSSADPLPPPPRVQLSHGDNVSFCFSESMTVVLSAFYAKLLIVLGVAFPITSTIQNEVYTNFTSDVMNAPRTRYGSLYLHMGVAGFSVGSIIYSFLQFGGYFDLSGDCQLLIVAIKPTMRILFMVAQTVFIFSYTDKSLKSWSVNPTLSRDMKQTILRVKSTNHFSVDCGSAHKGLFMGVAVLAGTIVSLMLFNGLSAACIRRMRTLPLRRAVAAMPLEHALLLVTQCGVYLYYLFQIIGAGFLIHRYPEGRRATRIISPLCAVIQSSCQTLLVLDAWSRRCADTGQRAGRQLVTFLLVGNFALWLLNRVKNARAEFHPLQMEFFGVWAWTLITHVSVPLLVCYRFQATVCFYEIWKNSYKRKKEYQETDIDDIELKITT
ncbi:hypothetical protein MSG28_001543 [Choristoneura fumiferana]|uniref:Uncharacterized protein n=1 Tax=Choristoneura fumiferana TaxID=7141 RepID=A0ACC0KUU9_CHOFU|nr:hypothetical protein MSG28_001543 [Choristoneura fumiferana]